MSLHEYAGFMTETNKLNVLAISQLRYVLTWGISKRNVQRWWLRRGLSGTSVSYHVGCLSTDDISAI